MMAVDIKPELGVKSISNFRDDIKTINPSINNGYGFDVWYGLNQESSDDQLIERADLICENAYL